MSPRRPWPLLCLETFFQNLLISALKNYPPLCYDDLKEQNNTFSALLLVQLVERAEAEEDVEDPIQAPREGMWHQVSLWQWDGRELPSAPCPGAWILGQDWEVHSVLWAGSIQGFVPILVPTASAG